MDTEYDSSVDELVHTVLSQIDPNLHNTIEPIDPSIHFYYNSVNVCLGPQGCGKTTLLMKELIQLSRLRTPFTTIIYVSDGDFDRTFMALKDHIKLSIYKTSYQDFYRLFHEYVEKIKQATNHTFIIFEDASFRFIKDTDEINQLVCRLRHLRCTVWLNAHVWRSMNSMLKSQITCLFVFKGYSRQQMTLVYNQSSIEDDSSFFYKLYCKIQPNQCLWVNNYNQQIKII